MNLYMAHHLDHLNKLLRKTCEMSNGSNQTVCKNNMWLIYVPQSGLENGNINKDLFKSTPIRLDSQVFAVHQEYSSKFI